MSFNDGAMCGLDRLVSVHCRGGKSSSSHRVNVQEVKRAVAGAKKGKADASTISYVVRTCYIFTYCYYLRVC